jgi:ketosteroid isomerase-like protein
VTDVEQIINQLNQAAARKNVSAFVELLDPEAVWEHNLGTGSPEEGVYRGREQIGRLIERILEGWEYLHLVPTEIREPEPDVYRVRGELHCKHAESENEIVEPYQQRIEFRGGLLAKGRMVVGGSLDDESPQVGMVRASFKAYDAGDFDGLAELAHPDVEVHDWPEAADPRVYRGASAIEDAREEWSKAWESVRAEPTDFVEAGDRVFVVMRTIGRGRGSSIDVEMQTFGVYTFREGKIAKLQYFTDRESALEAAGLTDHEATQEAR